MPSYFNQCHKELLNKLRLVYFDSECEGIASITGDDTYDYICEADDLYFSITSVLDYIEVLGKENEALNRENQRLKKWLEEAKQREAVRPANASGAEEGKSCLCDKLNVTISD